MAKKKRKQRIPAPASFAFAVMQHVIEATGDKPEGPRPIHEWATAEELALLEKIKNRRDASKKKKS